MDAARRITQLGGWLAGTDIATLELTTPDLRIRLDRDVAPATGAASAARTATARPATGAGTAATPAPTVVEAHSVGVFLDTHPLATAPLAAVGSRVALGQTIGLLRIGALLLPVAAPADGVVERVLAVPGDIVGHGTPLFTLRPL
jgi:acetyl-CoA carboxylase biotin carboxyl carrier protein